MPAGEKDAKDFLCNTTAPGRFRGRSAVSDLFKRGGRLNGRYVTIIHSPANEPLPRIAIIVPKKMGAATRRNRARRVLREYVRTGLTPLITGKDILILCKKPVDELFLSEAKQEVAALFERLKSLSANRRDNENNPSKLRS